ncbi:hypothetical protein [Carboxylicivirga linearis]|uniref:Uncharacterized protein n=1 Tax=Carboxylicivirga linearis TaxID=1628157 RepID=A0ABS5K138_9BACT|nr:hypothetical protein [Carboxylicivirga linearis]MBS2100825.1 hypothetical protein [Carboxylicivirga linearis]
MEQEKISFCPPASALRDSWGSQRTLHTFANRTSRPTDQNLQKSAIFPPLRKQVHLRMNYLQWNTAITNHFFNEENEENEVTLYFSERIILEIGAANFEEPEDGYLKDFFTALRIGVNGINNNDYIQRIIDLEDRFLSGTIAIAGVPFKYPPYLTYLLAFILPFTSGEVDDSFSMSNFHGVAKKYFEDKHLTINYDRYIRLNLWRVDYLWTKLSDWLVEKNEFNLGYIEEINDPSQNRKYVSKYEYHILFRKEQEERLSKVFEKENILPDDAISEEQIKNLLLENSSYLKITKKTKDKIDTNDYIGDKIIKRAHRFYKKWTGATHIVDGVRGYARKKLILCLDFNTLSQKIKLKYLRVYTKDALPVNSNVNKPNGELINNLTQEIEIYSNPILDCFTDLNSNVELRDESNRIKYSWKTKEFYIFKKISHLDWVEIPKVEFNAGKSLIICKKEFYKRELDGWFNSFLGAKKLLDNNEITNLDNQWLALWIDEITKSPHPAILELQIQQEDKPKINFNKELYFGGSFFKDKLPYVWIENTENKNPIYAIFEDEEIKLNQKFETEIDENGKVVGYPINLYNFTDYHLKKINLPFKLKCGEIESQRFLTITDFKKVENTIIDSILPKRNSIGQITNNSIDYSKGIEHFFSNDKINSIKIFQNILDNQYSGFKNKTSTSYASVGEHYNPQHVGNILINYISAKGRLTKVDFELIIANLLVATKEKGEIKRIADKVRFQLQDTGFIDYNMNTSSLIVNKPHLIIKPTKKGTTTILTGARDNNFIKEIIDYANSNSITIDAKSEFGELFPQVIFLEFLGNSNNSIIDFTNRFNLIYKKSGLYMQFALSYHFSDISKWKDYISPVENFLDDFEGGYIFNIDKLHYAPKPNNFNKHLSLVKFTGISGYKTIHRLWYEGNAYDISNQQFGIFLYLYLYRLEKEKAYKSKINDEGWVNCGQELEEKEHAEKCSNILVYDENHEFLAVPLYCRLPRFFSQSISLLSGSSAEIKYLNLEKVKYQGKYLVYKNVPSLFVKNVFVNLKQKLNYTEINI